MAPTGDARGYWFVATDGGVFNFGDAHFCRLDRRHRPDRADRRDRPGALNPAFPRPTADLC